MSNNPTTTLDIVTLVVAIVGVSLAVLSLTWQAAMFHLSGSRPRVELRQGMIRRQGPGAAMLTTFPAGESKTHMGLLRGQGFTENVLVVIVRNRGRLSLSVDGISMKTAQGWSLQHLGDAENKPLPYRLEPEATERWHMPLALAQAAADTEGRRIRVWMVVDLGNGKTLSTKRRFRRAGTLQVEPR